MAVSQMLLNSSFVSTVLSQWPGLVKISIYMFNLLNTLVLLSSLVVGGDAAASVMDMPSTWTSSTEQRSMTSATNLPLHLRRSEVYTLLTPPLNLSTSQSFVRLSFMRESSVFEDLAMKRQSGLKTGGIFIFLGRTIWACWGSGLSDVTVRETKSPCSMLEPPPLD